MSGAYKCSITFLNILHTIYTACIDCIDKPKRLYKNVKQEILNLINNTYISKKAFFMQYYYFKDHNCIDVVKKNFKEKKIIIAATDTILGLIGPLESWAFEQLMAIKKRDSKPFVVLVNSYWQLKLLVHTDYYERVYTFVQRFWPGPLTCIVPLSPIYKEWLFERQQTIAIRMPLHKGLSCILDECGPLFSTSVNISGFPFAKSINEVSPLIMEQVCVAILDDFGTNEGLPSTIIDLTNDDPMLVRQGFVNVDDIVKNK